MNILIGCDPEVFLRDRKTGEFVSAAGFFPGTKSEPFKVDCGAIQVDGTALEFNITPADTETDFFNNVRTVYTQMEKMVHEVNPDWIIDATPVATYSDPIWSSIDESAKILGCDPDYRSFDGRVNSNPIEKLKDLPVRTGSGHIHIGWSKDENPQAPEHFEDARFIAHGFYSKHIFAAKTDDEERRLKYYGHNGSFRPKSYGVELRMPSNLWLKSERLIRGTFTKTRQTFEQLANASR